VGLAAAPACTGGRPGYGSKRDPLDEGWLPCICLFQFLPRVTIVTIVIVIVIVSWSPLYLSSLPSDQISDSASASTCAITSTSASEVYRSCSSVLGLLVFRTLVSWETRRIMDW
jgi:hypothetical protein